MSRMLAMLALVPFLASCGSSKPIPQAPQAVQAQRMRSDSTASGGSLRFSAVVDPDARAPLSFRIPGYVIAVTQTRGEDERYEHLVRAALNTIEQHVIAVDPAQQMFDLHGRVLVHGPEAAFVKPIAIGRAT